MTNKTERNHAFPPDEIPETIVREIFIAYGVGCYCSGKISIYDYDPSPHNLDGFEKIIISKQDVELQLPRVVVNIKEKTLELLEEKKKRVLAENHARLKKVQDEIDKLLCIDFTPNENPNDDIPF